MRDTRAFGWRADPAASTSACRVSSRLRLNGHSDIARRPSASRGRYHRFLENRMMRVTITYCVS
jgi:hypothetical protein